MYCDINTTLLDNINKQYNFNLASGSQLLNGSYYLLREADKNNSLSHVYLELYYWCSVKDNSDIDMIDTGYSSNWDITDYMKISYNKVRYMLSIAGTEEYVNIFFPFSRYRTKLDDCDYIRQTMETKTTDTYLDFECHVDFSDGNGYEEIKKQGYRYYTREFLDEQRLYKQDRILEENPVGEKSEKYL